MHYVPNTPETEREILEVLGIQRFEDLLGNIPASIMQKCNINLPEPLGTGIG